MNLAIVGSRYYTDYDIFKKYINDWIIKFGTPNKIISGGCRGVDTLAEKYAKENKINLEVIKPNWDLGKIAGPLRNTKIVNKSTHMIAFPSSNSKGTKDSIKKAKKNNLKLTIINL